MQEVPKAKHAKLQAEKEELQVRMLRCNPEPLIEVQKAVTECQSDYSNGLVSSWLIYVSCWF